MFKLFRIPHRVKQSELDRNFTAIEDRFNSELNLIAGSDISYPQVGAYQRGQIVFNSEPTSSGSVGWICTESGIPGSWEPFGIVGED